MTAARTSHGFDAACDDWRQVLGSANVATDPQTLDRYARTTGVVGTRPLGVLRPHSTEQVVELVRIASRHHVALYPISTGKNWGMGAACAVLPGQVIVDLSGLDRIVEINAELAYAVVEPGVTQKRLSDELRARGSSLVSDVTASACDTSLIGNYLERGDGFTLVGDRFSQVTGMQIVIADGTLVETGFNRLSERLGYASRWGLGPSIDGLFSQSNLGIVTRLGVALFPKPQQVVGYVLSIRQRDLGAVVDRLRPLRQTGILQAPLRLFNAPRMGKLATDLRLFGVELEWGGLGGLYGTKGTVGAAVKEIRRALGSSARMQLITLGRLRALTKILLGLRRYGFVRAVRALSPLVTVPAKMHERLRGIPSNEAVERSCKASPGWNPAKKSVDLLDHDVGVFWLAHICPLTSRDTQRAVGVVDEVGSAAGVKLPLTLSMMDGRTLLVFATVDFVRGSAEECERAEGLRRRLHERLASAGFPPMRAEIELMTDIGSPDQAYWQVVRRIKEALDPAGVLAPGRYSPWMLSG